MEYTIKSVDWRTTETDVGNQNKYREVKEINTVCNVGTNGDVLVWVYVCFPFFVWLIQQYFPIEPKQSKYFHEKWVSEVVYIISKRHLTCCCLLPAILSILYQATSSTFSHINRKTRMRKKKIMNFFSSNNNCKAFFGTNFQPMAPKIGNSKKDAKNVS